MLMGKDSKRCKEGNHYEKELTKDIRILIILFFMFFEYINTFYNIIVR